MGAIIRQHFGQKPFLADPLPVLQRRQNKTLLRGFPGRRSNGWLTLAWPEPSYNAKSEFAPELVFLFGLRIDH